MNTPMTSEEVITLMKSSTSEREWNDNCDKVKAAFGGRYPLFWFDSILLSGLANQVAAQWNNLPG